MRHKSPFIGALAAWVLACAPVWASTDTVVDERKIQELVLKDAMGQGIDKVPEVQAAMRAAQEGILIRAWERKLIATQGIPQPLRDAVYQELADLLGNAEYRLYHVFTGNEKGARGLVERMKSGRDWPAIDLDAVMGQKGAHTLRQTDWINLSAVLPEFRPFIKAMKPGEVVAQPIRAKDGWHVVGIVETRPFKLPPPEQISQEVTRLAERRIVGDKLKALLAAHKP